MKHAHPPSIESLRADELDVPTWSSSLTPQPTPDPNRAVRVTVWVSSTPPLPSLPYPPQPNPNPNPIPYTLTLTLTLTQFDVTMGVESNRMAKVPPLSSVLRLGCCAALLCHPAQGAPGGSGTQSYRVEGETVGHWAPGHTARWVALLYIAFTPPLTT